MTDRELLEMAARAAGHTGFSGEDYQGPYFCIPADPAIPRSEPQIFRWLTDDGDALRLAVRLHIIVCSHPGESWAQRLDITIKEPYGFDADAATRRAIVSAAAEIARAALAQEGS